MRLLHVADLHLDRSFEGITEFPAEIETVVEQANEKVWQRIVANAIKKQVDVVILAGDTFHQSQASLKMQRVFFDGIQALSEQNIVVVMSFGNHDYFKENKFWFAFPENTLVFTGEQVSTKEFRLKNGESVSFSGFSYQGAWIKEHKAEAFPRRSSAAYHIGLYHGELGTANSYAPFQLSELQKLGYDYWALGHIHKGQQLTERICYSGTPQGHTVKEREGTGVLLVELNQTNIQIERLSVAEIAWIEKSLSLKSVSKITELQDYLFSQLDLQTTGLNFLKLYLKDFEHLGKEFSERINNQELFQLLSDGLLAASKNHFYLWQLDWVASSTATQKILVSEELFQQGLQIYQNAEIFDEIVADLWEQPEVNRILERRDFQRKVLSETEKTIKKQLRFED